MGVDPQARNSPAVHPSPAPGAFLIIDVGPSSTGWLRPTLLLLPIRAVRVVANCYDVAFAGIFGWKLLEVSDLQFNWRLASDTDLFEALQPFQRWPSMSAS